MAMRLGTRDAQIPDRTFGLFELRRLEWDTAHFGCRMGALGIRPAALEPRAAALAAELRLALAEAADDDYAHVILRVPAERLDVARVAEQCGLRLVDVAVDLEACVQGRHAQSPAAPGVRPANPEDLDSLRAIAESAFEFSRFATDPFFSGSQVAGFFRQWITNLCDGLANVVIVATAADEIAGFSSCALVDGGGGRIPLIATSEAHRRQGIGRALIDASLRWFAAEGVRRIRVKTQAANYAAMALYHRAGFTVATAELTFSTTLSKLSALAR
jgi:dTDP-4-amino-4,6-dideoxy-D-galactose acyltransferase